MRTLSFILLLSLSLYKVDALRCYSCSSVTSNADCNQNIKQCLEPLDTCMTTEDIAGDKKIMVKQCASFATCQGAEDGAGLDPFGDGNVVTCCSTDLCNNVAVATAKPSSGATTIHIHTALLLLPIGVLSLLSKYYR
ncbi:prostate stem cell antigen-like [Coregonus clupeaformis]|uniref:prostate stem cell antigen-like n=1 Tax=Coregonus clupeaformis TaxID=59861 RepID=UPI001BE10767|nr:prostate stem cell antigen-like [Coregonus clupeaformis]